MSDDLKFLLQPTKPFDLGHGSTTYYIDLPSTTTSYKTIPSSTGSNLDTLNFSHQMATNSILDPDVRLLLPIDITVTGTATHSGAGLSPHEENKVGLSQYGVYQMMDSISTSIDHVGFNVTPQRYINALSETSPLDLKAFSMDAVQPDQFQRYDDAGVVNMARNVLGIYGTSDIYPSRGGYFTITEQKTTAVSNNCSVTYSVDLVVSLPFSPFISAGQSKGLLMKDFQMTFQFNRSKAWRLLSRFADLSGGRVWSDVTVAARSEPKLMLKTYSIPDTLSPHLYVPNTNRFKPVYYQHDQVHMQEGKEKTIAQNATEELTTSSMNRSTFPKKILIWAEIDRTYDPNNDGVNRTCSNSNAYGLISNLSLNIAERSYFGGASTSQLYQMSVKNGLRRDWIQASRYVGFPIVIDCSEDLGVEYVSGESGSYNISAKANVTNLCANRQQQFKLNIALIIDGVLRLDGERPVPITGLSFTHDDKLRLVKEMSLQQVANVDRPFVLGAGLKQFHSGLIPIGAGFLDDFWRGLKSGVGWLGDNVIKPAIPGLVNVGSKLLLGSGEGGAMTILGGANEKKGARKTKSKTVQSLLRKV